MGGEPLAVNARQNGIMFNAMPERLAGHLAAAVAGKQNVQALTMGQRRTAMFQIILSPVYRLFPQWHQPPLITFTNHPHHALPQADVRQGQPDQFGHPQTGGLEHLQHRLIEQFDGIGDSGRRQQITHLGLAEIFGQTLR